MSFLGRYIPGQDDSQLSNPKRWKATFRCAMNSLPDVEEVKERSRSKGLDAFRVSLYTLLAWVPLTLSEACMCLKKEGSDRNCYNTTKHTPVHLSMLLWNWPIHPIYRTVNSMHTHWIIHTDQAKSIKSIGHEGKSRSAWQSISCQTRRGGKLSSVVQGTAYIPRGIARKSKQYPALNNEQKSLSVFEYICSLLVIVWAK